MRLVLFLLLAGAAHADQPPMTDEAKGHYDNGLSLYQQRKYEDAISEFRTAFDRAGRREILFAWAQAERLSGDCPSAVVLYRKFLKLEPTPTETAAAELNLKRCQSALSTRPEEAQSPPVVVEVPPPLVAPPPTPEPITTPPPPPPPRVRWSRDPAFLALISVGAVGLAGGIALAGASASVENDAGSASSYRQYGDRIELASTLRLSGFVCIGAGAVFALAGVIRAAVVHRRQPRLSAGLGATAF